MTRSLHENINNTIWFSTNLIKQLQQKSKARTQANEEFQKIEKNIAKFKVRKERKKISLNEEILRAERAEDKDDKDEKDKKKDEKKKKKEDDIFPKSAYNDEVLSVTIDYVNLLKQQKTAGK